MNFDLFPELLEYLSKHADCQRGSLDDEIDDLKTCPEENVAELTDNGQRLEKQIQNLHTSAFNVDRP